MATFPDTDSLPPGDEPIIVWAKFVKLRTDDGLMKIDEALQGTRIAVNARTRTTGVIRTKRDDGKMMWSQREIIYKVPPNDTEWLPTEFLQPEE